MSLQNINLSPKFTKSLITAQMFKTDPLIVVDVGARGGYETHWDIYGEQVRLICFEADAEECELLNRNLSNSRIHYFPFALDQSKGKRTFYVTANSDASGFYAPDMQFWRRFPGEVFLRIEKTIELNTIDFDSFARENNINSVDFVKLDTEGSELDILKGAIGMLNGTILGLSIEVEFSQCRQGQPVFSDVDSFLRTHGFNLFDLSIYRHGRKALHTPTSLPVPINVERGQVLWGQALYLRDGVNEIEHLNLLEGGWSDVRILKLASIMEIFYLNDCATELLQVAQNRGFLKDLDVAFHIKQLVPDNILNMAAVAGLKKSFIRFLPRPVLRATRGLLVNTRDFINEIINI